MWLFDKVSAGKPPSSKKLELKRGICSCTGAVSQSVLNPAWCGRAVALMCALGWEEENALGRGEEHKLLGYKILNPVGLGRGKARVFMLFPLSHKQQKCNVLLSPGQMSPWAGAKGQD